MKASHFPSDMLERLCVTSSPVYVLFCVPTPLGHTSSTSFCPGVRIPEKHGKEWPVSQGWHI